MKMLKLFISTILVFSICGCKKQEAHNENTTTTTTTYIEPEPTEARAHFIAVGDNLIHTTIYEEAKRFAAEWNTPYDYYFTPMYDDVASYIKDADVAFLNQETNIGGDDLGISGYPMFNTPQDIAQQMVDLGFDLFNTATNHSLDKSWTGIKNARTKWFELMNNYDIAVAGTYISDDDRSTIRTIERNGITFALLAYAQHTNGMKIPYGFSIAMFDDEKIKEDVAKAKEIADVVIVSAHWGTEEVFDVNSFQKKYAKYFNDLGVDLVIGTGPHYAQTMDYFENENGEQTIVFYSLGNFIGGMLHIYDSLSVMAGLDFVKDLETGNITIENVTWMPLVIHFEGNQNNILPERWGYHIYPLKDYTQEMANRHVLNGYNGQTITIEDFVDKSKQLVNNKCTIVLE